MAADDGDEGRRKEGGQRKESTKRDVSRQQRAQRRRLTQSSGGHAEATARLTRDATHTHARSARLPARKEEENSHERS